MIETHAPARVVSLLDPETPFPHAEAYDESRHLKLPVHDIAADYAGMVAPCEIVVGKIVSFVRGWDRSAPILIHCWAGISRSTATAFITACVHNPDADEGDIAWAIRRASPTASPNPRIVAIADVLLARQGRMRRAVEAIGRGAPGWPEIEQAEPFEIPSSFERKRSA